MKTRKQSPGTTAAVAALFFLTVVGPAMAEDPFAAWQGVQAGVLDGQRGGDAEVAVDDAALAAAVGLQHQTVSNVLIVNGNLSGGSINAGNGTFAGQVMSLNVINAGNNVALQNQNVIAVNLVDSMVTYNMP